MLDGSHDTKLNALLIALDAAQKSGLAVAVPRASQRIAHLVAEGGDAGHAADIGLHGQLLVGDGTRSGTPALTIDEDVLWQGCAYGVHRLDIMHAH